MTRKGGLGRGLDALIPGNDRIFSGVLQLDINRIRPNPRQPRSDFNEEGLDELADSIHEHGLLQPVIVSEDADNPDNYILIAGERRWLAAKKAGLERLPALLRETNDQQRLELALIENIQRLDLNPLETAEAYRQLIDDFQLSHEEISRKVGKSRTAVTNTLRLLKLPQDVRAALVNGQISEGHARALLALFSPQAQSSALNIIHQKGLNVRQTENLVRLLSGEKPPPVPRPVLPPELNALEERLRQRLGTKVRVTHQQNGGTIIIHYYSDEELNSLVDHLLGEEE
jgi:ParB family chromosome partitioning protein